MIVGRGFADWNELTPLDANAACLAAVRAVMQECAHQNAALIELGFDLDHPACRNLATTGVAYASMEAALLAERAHLPGTPALDP